MKEKDIASLQHTTWRCQYHVVFAPKCLLALAQRQPPAMPGSVKRLYSEKDLLVE